MAGRQCYHCKRWVKEGEEHDCWTTTESALTRNLPEDLRDAWDRLRETASSFGDQRIYASHHSIMFSRKSCYFFVRPKMKYLEVCVFLGRTVKSPHIQRVDQSSKTKQVHSIRIIHPDQVEAPITEWLREAYELSAAPANAVQAKRESKPEKKAAPKPKPSAKADSGKQIARVRRICQSIQGTTEKISHGEPTFFTPKRVFAMFANNHHGEDTWPFGCRLALGCKKR